MLRLWAASSACGLSPLCWIACSLSSTTYSLISYTSKVRNILYQPCRFEYKKPLNRGSKTVDLRRMSRAVEERKFCVDKTDIRPRRHDVQGNVDVICNSHTVIELCTQKKRRRFPFRRSHPSAALWAGEG